MSTFVHMGTPWSQPPDAELGARAVGSLACCEHRRLSHTYTTTTRRNDGPCLVRGCGCAGEHEEETT